MFRNSNFNNNFLIPNDQNFNDDNLEDELQAILNENEPQTKKSFNPMIIDNFHKKTNNLIPDNLSNLNSNVSPNLYQIDFNKLNLDDDCDIDQNFDEDDPDLNKQLADIIGQEYKQNISQPLISQASISQASISQTTIPQISNSKTLVNEISKNNTNSNNENCLLLQNSHFFNQKELETKNNLYEKLKKLKDDYKKSALKAKNENDLENAKFYFRKYKELISCLEDINCGKTPNTSLLEEKQSDSKILNPNKNLNLNESTKTTDAPPTPKNFLEDLELRKKKINESYQKAISENDQRKMRSFSRVIKQYENAIKSYKANKEFDYSSLPVPPGFDEIPEKIAQKSNDSSIKSKDSNTSVINTNTAQNDVIEKKNLTSTAKTILEELEQRKNKFNETLLKVKAINDTSRIRMVERILKQYELAIKASKLGNKFDYSILPVPPGFEEISQEMFTVKETSSKKTQEAQIKTNEQIAKPKPVFKRALSINDKQLDYLLQRQKLFKEAAIESKKRNDITQAKEYLKKSKGFEPLIDAVRNGLPIDASSIPIPPQLEDDFVIVSNFVENTELDLNQEELYDKLLKELTDQIDLCNKNKENFLKIGDVSTGSKFEKYLIEMKKDYEMLKSYRLRNEKVPKFRYENKIFSIVVCNTDLQINELSIQIIRGIDYPCKNPVDSYVKFEFPFPKDSPQPAKTHSFKNSLYPEYNQFFKFSIDRKSRSLARIFKKPIKFEVYSKGGFFKSDELIGHANIPLSDLEKKCTIYDSFPLMNGRKETGGKLQVRIKIREPLFAKQIEEIKEKWLMFG